MLSIPAILLYILFFVVGWLFARWRGAQQQTAQMMAPAVATPKPAAKKLESTANSDQTSSVEKAPAMAAVASKEPETADQTTSQDNVSPSAKDEIPKEKKKPKKSAPKPIVSSDPDKPELLAAPRDGEANDLKRVKGIGPANEKKLNAFGIYHFDQIANWSPEQAEWIGKELSFPGRIEREDWIEQAKVLASGGDTEFSKRSDKR